MKAIYLTIGILSVGLLASNTYSQKLEQTIKTELPCFNTTELFNSLGETYKEVPIAIGKTGDEAKSTMSLWLNPADNSWTILATNKELTCVVGSGTAMKFIPVKKGISV